MNLNGKEQQIIHLEKKIESLEKEIVMHKHQVDSTKIELENKIKNLENQSNEIEEMKIKMREKIIYERNKMKRVLEKNFENKQSGLKNRLHFTEAKLKQLKEILDSDDWDSLMLANVSLSSPSVYTAKNSDLSCGSFIANEVSSFHINSSTVKKLSINQSFTNSCLKIPNSYLLNKECLKTKYDQVSISNKDLDLQRSSKSPQKCNTLTDLTNNSLSNYAENLSVSRKEDGQSVLVLEEESTAVCTESVSRIPRKYKKTSMRETNSVAGEESEIMKSPLSSKNSSKMSEHRCMETKKQKLSMFSIKKKHFSNIPIKNDAQIKTFPNLPLTYEMNSGSAKKTHSQSFRNFICRNLGFFKQDGKKAKFCHKNSHANKNIWIEHKSFENQMNTDLSPTIGKKKSLYKLSIEDITNGKASKYILHHLELNSLGEVESRLYKGDILRSFGGGAQVIFNDVKKTCVTSSESEYDRKNSEYLPSREVEARCTVSLECHGIQTKE